MFNVKVIGADKTANSGALAASLIVSTSPAKLFSLTIFNTNAAAQYIQVFDAIAVPANATVPKLCMKVNADSQGSFDFGDGRIFPTGIVVCNSSTAGTKTIGAADVLFDATFRVTS